MGGSITQAALLAAAAVPWVVPTPGGPAAGAEPAAGGPAVPHAASGAAGLDAAAGTGDPVWVERRAWLMGTWLRVRLAAPTRDSGFSAAGRAFEAVEEAEARWSSWRDDTEMARLNRAEPGTPVALSRPFLSVLAELRRWRARTGGAFDPAVGALVEAWGLRDDGRRPASREIRDARRRTGLDHLRVDTAGGTATRTRPGVWLDAGAFGKGLALERARERLRRAGVGAALLDFGGQLAAWGPGPAGSGCWRVGVAHPRHRGRAETTLRLCDASAATTSGSERGSHVLDPRSGRPAPAWGSVTVVHPDPMVADLLSTALFVMGPEDGRAWAEGRDVAALFLRTEDGGGFRRTSTPAMEPLLAGGTGPAADRPGFARFPMIRLPTSRTVDEATRERSTTMEIR